MNQISNMVEELNTIIIPILNDIPEITSNIEDLQNSLSNINSTLSTKADKLTVEQSLAAKANDSEVIHHNNGEIIEEKIFTNEITIRNNVDIEHTVPTTSSLIKLKDSTNKVYGEIRSLKMIGNDTSIGITSHNYIGDGYNSTSLYIKSNANGKSYVYVEPDNLPFGVIYNNTLVTSRWSINNHPVKTWAGKTFYVGGANASDTLDLFNGRGETPDKPFATLNGCVYQIQLHYYCPTDAFTIILQSDIIVETTLAISVSSIYGLRIKSDSTKRTLTIKEPISVYNCNVDLININIVTHGTISYVFFVANGGTLSLNDIYLSGSVSVSTIYVILNGIAHIVSVTGSVTGRRYHVERHGIVVVYGRGENCIPGTEPGFIDGMSHYL